MYLVCEDNPRFEETGKLIKAAINFCIEVRNKPVLNECFFCYGTRPFVLPMVNHPYHVFSKQEYIYDFSLLLSLYPLGVGSTSRLKTLLNWDAQILTVGQANYVLTENHRDYFCRPNNGDKAFSGHVIDRKAAKDGLHNLFNLNLWDLVVVAPEKEMKNTEEYRFFCIYDGCDVKMTGCRYIPDDSLDIPDEVIEFARAEANYIFDKLTFGNSFVLDICYEKPEYKHERGFCSIVELNSWNSSGYYCIDPYTILEMAFSV